MRRFLLAAVICTVALGCSSDTSTDETPAASGRTSSEPTAGPNEILAHQFTWTPESILVKAGTKVTWKNADAAAHKVQSGKPDASSTEFTGPLDSKDKTFDHTFAKAGTYD